jgi:hypothetical protein
LGDGIFALRYIPALLEQGVCLEVVARPALLPLIQASHPNVKIHNEDEVVVVGYWDQVPSPDFWVYGLSIPFRAGFWRPMNTAKFLKAPTTVVEKFKERILRQNLLHLPVYTVNWHGRIDTESDRSRAFSVQEFTQVTGLEKNPCLVISLQKDASEEEITCLQELVGKSGGQFINAAPELGDFAATAAWIAASDRLLTCDTSVAHVGGALGHPTTVYVRNKAIWQWLRKDPEKTSAALWYESALVQFALAPKISWLFTTLNKPKSKMKESIDDPSPSPLKDSEFSSTEIRPARHRGPFNFAGRAE